MTTDKINAEIVPEGFEIRPSFATEDPEMRVVLMAGIRGDKGEKGDKGDPGEKGDKGDPGEYAEVDTEISSTSTNPLENQAIHAALSNAIASVTAQIPDIRFNTKAAWDTETTYVSELNVVYVYTDYKTSGGINVAGIKVGDGSTYLIDMPFQDEILYDHIQDSTIHVTSAEKEFWNNKVRAYYSLVDGETLVLTTN